MNDPQATGEFALDSEVFRSVVITFEKAHGRGQKPDIDAFLRGEGPERWRLLIELVHSELELRLRGGESAQLAEYLARFPDLLNFPNELAAVLETEVKLRVRQGDGPAMKDYEQQYPALGSRVRDVFRKIGAAPPEVPGTR